jgi:hypothetical protein
MVKKIIDVDYDELKRHLICTYGGVYIDKLDDGSFEIRCVARFHGGDNLLILHVPPENKKLVKRKTK